MPDIAKAKTDPTSRHPRQDRSFKTLFERHTRDTLTLVAGKEAEDLPKHARIEILPQEQLPRGHDGAVHHIDALVRVTARHWRRQFLVVTEEATEPRKFNALRLVEYVVRVCRRYRTQRIVPVVVFLRGGRLVRHVNIGTELDTYIKAKFVVCPLAELPADEHLKGANFAGRILAVAMSFKRGEGPRVVREAMQRVIDEVKDDEERALWLGVIEDLARLSARDWVEFRTVDLPRMRRRKKMPGPLTELMLRAERAERRTVVVAARSEARGEARGALLTSLQFRGLRLTKAQQAQISACTNVTQLRVWVRRALTAASAGEIFSSEPVRRSTKTAKSSRGKVHVPKRRGRPSESAGISR